MAQSKKWIDEIREVLELTGGHAYLVVNQAF